MDAFVNGIIIGVPIAGLLIVALHHLDPPPPRFKDQQWVKDAEQARKDRQPAAQARQERAPQAPPTGWTIKTEMSIAVSVFIVACFL